MGCLATCGHGRSPGSGRGGCCSDGEKRLSPAARPGKCMAGKARERTGPRGSVPGAKSTAATAAEYGAGTVHGNPRRMTDLGGPSQRAGFNLQKTFDLVNAGHRPRQAQRKRSLRAKTSAGDRRSVVGILFALLFDGLRPRRERICGPPCRPRLCDR